MRTLASSHKGQEALQRHNRKDDEQSHAPEQRWPAFFEIDVAFRHSVMARVVPQRGMLNDPVFSQS
jgi:hypothetical protein